MEQNSLPLFLFLEVSIFQHTLRKRFLFLFSLFQPQNVMFKNEGGSKIKLIDFSLARQFDPQQETKISFGTAEFVGKLYNTS